MTKEFYIHNLWRDLAGVQEIVPVKLPDIDIIRRKQWSCEFERLRQNRMVMGAFRYGMFGDPNKPSFDSVNSAIKRLNEYQATGNIEHLLDAANLCMVEYVEGRHPNKHFKAADDGIHTEVK